MSTQLPILKPRKKALIDPWQRRDLTVKRHGHDPLSREHHIGYSGTQPLGNLAVKVNRAIRDARVARPGVGRWVEYIMPDLRRVYVESNLKKIMLGKIPDDRITARAVIKPGADIFTNDLQTLIFMRMIEVSGDLVDVIRTAPSLGLSVPDPETRGVAKYEKRAHSCINGTEYEKISAMQFSMAVGQRNNTYASAGQIRQEKMEQKTAKIIPFPVVEKNRDSVLKVANHYGANMGSNDDHKWNVIGQIGGQAIGGATKAWNIHKDPEGYKKDQERERQKNWQAQQINEHLRLKKMRSYGDSPVGSMDKHVGTGSILGGMIGVGTAMALSQQQPVVGKAILGLLAGKALGAAAGFGVKKFREGRRKSVREYLSAHQAVGADAASTALGTRPMEV